MSEETKEEKYVFKARYGAPASKLLLEERYETTDAFVKRILGLDDKKKQAKQ